MKTHFGPFHSQETQLWTLINIDALFLSGLSCVEEIKKFFQPISFKSGVPFSSVERQNVACHVNT